MQLSDKKHCLRLYKKGLSDGDIAYLVGISKASVFHWRKKNNLKSQNVIANERAIELYKKGLSDREIAKAMKTYPSNVAYWRQCRNLQPNKLLGELVTKKCSCGNSFQTKAKNQKWCPECQNIKRQYFYVIRQMRGSFHKIIERNPDFAKKLRAEMKIEQGEDFTKLALDGLAEE